MKIRTRLTIYNVLIVFMSLIVLSFVAHFLITTFEKSLYNVDNLVIDKNIFVVENLIENVDKISNSSYFDLQEKLSPYNYSLFIFEDTDLLYGKEEDTSDGLQRIIRNYTNENDEVKSIFVDGSTLIIRNINNKIIIAMSTSVESEFLGERGSHFQIFVLKFSLISIAAVVLIVAIASFFSNKITKSLMKPVYLLTQGAKRIQKGNLEEPIYYEKDNEFTYLCQNFNDMQKHLKQEQEKNIAADASKKEIINGLSHDIRTPLTTVKGYIKGIQDGVASTKEKREKYLITAYNKTLEIERLLDKLFNTYEYEITNLNKQETVLLDFVQNFVNKNQEELSIENIKIKITSPSEKIKCNIDQEQIERVLNNLLNNSLKYSSSKKLEIEIGIWETSNSTYLSFKDNGIGVKEENLHKLFDEFWKEDESRNAEKKGNGLGLFIIKNIIISHGGKIKAKNKKGLLIEIELPKEKSETIEENINY